jgi:hypothetical protein
MKKLLLFPVVIFFAFAAKSQDIVGTWNGTLSVQGHNLRLVFNISKDDDVYKATMDSPDQGASGIAVSSVKFENNKITLTISAAQAEYTGELKGNTITGNFKQMGFSLPLNLTRAGEQSSGTNGFLRGRLFDSQTREALLFSSVALIRDSDSSLVTGAITDEDGRFVLENLRDGNYRLRITNIGYHPYVSHTVELKRGNNRLDLGTFFINPSTTQLTQVEIVAARPVLEQQAGKLVFNVSQSTTSVGDNALETLKKFPGVTVDNEDNISLNGSSSVLVMIDDRPTHLTGAQLANLLKSMPSSSIERIEAMDNPSARYDAEGIGGILNIKTKRTRMMGYSGSVFTGARYHREFVQDGGFDLNFRNNNFTVFANFNISQNNTPTGSAGYTNFPNGTRREENGAEKEDWQNRQTGRTIFGKGGFDYYINNRNIASLSYQINDRKHKVAGDMRTRIYGGRWDGVNSAFQQLFDSDIASGNQNLSLNYQHIFDSTNQRQFFIDAGWIQNHQKGGGSNEIRYYLGDFLSMQEKEGYEVDQPLTSNIFSIKGDLEYPLNKETKIETGVKYSFVNNDNNQRHDVIGDSDLSIINHYIYSENILSFYGMINHTFSPKLSVEAGLRGEFTALEGNNKTIDSIHTNSYFNVFPSLGVNQKLTEKTGLNFSYTYRLRRPNYTDLNPIETRNSAFSFNSGNPYLNPDYSHIFRLAYTYNHLPIVRLAYARSDGEIRRITHYRRDTTFSKPENLGKNNAVNLSLMFQHTFFDKWRLLVVTGGEYSKTEFTYNDVPEKRDFFGGRYYVSNDITLSRTMSLDVNSWGMFPRKALFTKNAGMYSVNMGLRKSFFNRSLTVTLNLNDIFNTANKWTNDSKFPAGDGNYTTNYSEYYWASRSVSLRLTYRFGKGSVQTRRMREAAAEEAGRMGDTQQGQGGGQAGGGGQ